MVTRVQGRRCIQRTIFDPAPGPVAILGIHLCGQLSVQAVELFNTAPRRQAATEAAPAVSAPAGRATMLALKPCCLPQLWAGMAPMRWELANGRVVIDVAEVGVKGRFVKNTWRGPDRRTMAAKFGVWADSLYAGIDCPSAVAATVGEGEDEFSCRPCEGESEKQQGTENGEGGGGGSAPMAWKESECLQLWEDYDGNIDTLKYQNRYLWAFRV